MKKEALIDDNNKMASKIIDLESQIDYLLNELIELSQGIGEKAIWFNDSHSWDLAMRCKSGLAIKKLHEMRK